MTLAVLRALHAIIGDALEDIDAVYSTAASSRSSSCTLPKEPEADVLPPSPASSTQPKSSARRAGTPPLLSNHSPTPATTLSVSAPSKRIIDFPSLDDPVDPADDADAEAERLRSNPAVANAVSRIVAACGQLSITVRSPFLVLCDAGMGYHLPSALRFLEAAHIPELLRPAGPEGLHVSAISAALGVDAEVEGRIAHILRLLATHHLLIEREPNVFALNRISAMLDTGKTYADVARAPEKKYESTNGVAAFFALNTDELFKASAYLTESILPHTAPPEEVLARNLLPLSPPKPTSITANASPISAGVNPNVLTTPKNEPRRQASTPTSVRDDGPMQFARPRRGSAPDSPPVSLQAKTYTPGHAHAQSQGRTPKLRRLLSRPKLTVPSTNPSPAPPLSPVSMRSPANSDDGGSSFRLAATSTPRPSPAVARADPPSSASAHTKNSWIQRSPIALLKPRTPKLSLRPGAAASTLSVHAGLRSPMSSGFFSLRKDEQEQEPEKHRDGLQLEPAFALAPAPQLRSAPPSTTRLASGAAWQSHSRSSSTLALQGPLPLDEPVQLHTPAASRSPTRTGMEPEGTRFAVRTSEGGHYRSQSQSQSQAKKDKRPQTGRARSGSMGVGGSPPLTAFNLSQRTGSHFWAWLEAPGNEARLARFGSAMGGSRGWEEDGIEAFPFASLPDGALVVDVGGGIGSTSMLLAERFKGLRFVIQDREAVCKLGRDAWRARCPELLEEGRAVFQVHDFFTPQPARHTPVGAFILRVILHDWPDAFARRILVQLRRAAAPDTFLVIGDHVLPYACACDDTGSMMRGKEGGAEENGDRDTGKEENGHASKERNGHANGGEEKDSQYGEINKDKDKQGGVAGANADVDVDSIEGAEALRTLRGAKWPLLANLGQASANAYWMDLTMQVTFNGLERTLPELVALTASAGWRIVRVARTEGSLFGHIVAVPAPMPPSPALSHQSRFTDVSAASPRARARNINRDWGVDGNGNGDWGKNEDGDRDRERVGTLVIGDGCDEDDLPPMMVTRPSTPALDMFGFGGLPPRGVGVGDDDLRGGGGGGGEGGKGKKRGEGMWVRWVRSRRRGAKGAVEGEQAREAKEMREMREEAWLAPPVPEIPPQAQTPAQGRSLLKKVSQYFAEGS